MSSSPAKSRMSRGQLEDALAIACRLLDERTPLQAPAVRYIGLELARLDHGRLLGRLEALRRRVDRCRERGADPAPLARQISELRRQLALAEVDLRVAEVELGVHVPVNFPSILVHTEAS